MSILWAITRPLHLGSVQQGCTQLFQESSSGLWLVESELAAAFDNMWGERQMIRAVILVCTRRALGLLKMAVF